MWEAGTNQHVGDLNHARCNLKQAFDKDMRTHWLMGPLRLYFLPKNK